MKVSFTHLIAWAIVKAAQEWPVMARHYEETDGKPTVVEAGSVNLGIAVDVERKGQRSLLVPCIKGADHLDFAGFHSYYEELITKTRENSLTADDFQGTNISLTNPGGLGTVASVPRLMSGQGTIVACGSLAYPVEWRHAPPGEDQGARGLQGHDHDLDLRPPCDPGGGVRVVPPPDRGAAPGRGRLLRVGRRRPRDRYSADHRRPSGLGLGAAADGAGRLPASRARRLPPSRTQNCSRRSRPRPRCSRPTARTGTSPLGSTRSGPSRRATRRWSRRA